MQSKILKMNTEEIWKDIPGYEGLYQVSDQGNVRSFKTTGKEILSVPKLRKQVLDENGDYFYLKLHINGKRKRYNTHQLVAMAFLNHIPNGHIDVINHIDRNKLNNKLSNLEIKDVRYNSTEYRENPGISWSKHNKKYTIRISINNHRVDLGSAKTIDEANIVYQNALKNIDQYDNDDKKFKKLCNPNYKEPKHYYFKKENKKWVSEITINSKKVHLGYYENENKAAQIYQTALNNKHLYDNNATQFRELVKAIALDPS